MHASKLPLTTWLWAAFLMATHSNGISALQCPLWSARGTESLQTLRWSKPDSNAWSHLKKVFSVHLIDLLRCENKRHRPKWDQGFEPGLLQR